MENLIDGLKDILKDQVKIKVDDANLKIVLKFEGEKKSREELGDESEVRDMLKIIGGLIEEIHMEINIDEESQLINIHFKNRNDMEKVYSILENLWERAAILLKKAFVGDFMAIKDLGDFTE
ncbi:MAG: hypothetical protein ACFFBC_15850 [Promethearchaeota archaeon]